MPFSRGQPPLLDPTTPGASGGGGALVATAPRLLAVLEEGACAELIEEWAPLEEVGSVSRSEGASAYFSASVAELELDDGAQLRHSLVQLEGERALHFRSTLVNQVWHMLVFLEGRVPGPGLRLAKR
jgi:hypothetical protein